MDAESSSKVEQLRSVCGMDEQSAEAFLGMAEGSVERAVELFFETAGNPSAGAGAGGSGGGAGDAMEEEDARLAAQLYEQDMQEQWGPPAAAGPGAAAGAGPMAFCQVCGCDVEVEVDDAQGFACCVNCGRVLEERFPAAGHEGEPDPFAGPLRGHAIARPSFGQPPRAQRPAPGDVVHIDDDDDDDDEHGTHAEVMLRAMAAQMRQAEAPLLPGMPGMPGMPPGLSAMFPAMLPGMRGLSDLAGGPAGPARGPPRGGDGADAGGTGRGVRAGNDGGRGARARGGGGRPGASAAPPRAPLGGRGVPSGPGGPGPAGGRARGSGRGGGGASGSGGAGRGGSGGSGGSGGGGGPISDDEALVLEDDEDFVEARAAVPRRPWGVPGPSGARGAPAPFSGSDDEALARQLMEEQEAEVAAAYARNAQGGGPSGLGDEDAGLAGAFDRHQLEEARMLEASMLGIPYEPRLPTMGGPPGGGASAVPEVREARGLRWEQDQAYEESLAADRMKQAAAQREQEAAAAEARRVREEAEAAARAAAAEEARIRAELSRKASSLPPEPEAGPDAVSIMVRWPDGARQARRFRRQDPLQAVFDYIDTQHQAATVKPGSYSLVSSYPRKAFSDGTPGSLADVGITADTALFLEPSSK